MMNVSYFIYFRCELDQKHLENSKIGLENLWFFVFQKSGNSVKVGLMLNANTKWCRLVLIDLIH